MVSSILNLSTVNSFLPPLPGTESRGLAFQSCWGIGFHCRIVSLAGYKVTTQACLFAVLAASTLSRCLLLAVLVNSFFLAAKEGFHSPHAGGCPSACGWSCFSKILGKDVVNPSITSQSCFNTQC